MDIPVKIAPKQVARFINARPNGPENFGSSSEAANDGSHSDGTKNPSECRMAPISKNQNDGHFRKARSFGRRAFAVVMGRRPFTNKRHGIRPMA